MGDAKLIHEPAALEAALFRLHGAERLALDTEFMRERTYHPQLCLVQIATETDCCLIDPLAGLDLAPLYELLLDRSRLKILHAARQDIEVLLNAGGAVPGPLFDTQIAAALLGFAPQVGYAELVARQLGHSIDKGQTRTDWSKRPLTPAQLAYAADDVRHLLTLQTDLQAALAANGRAQWVLEETAALENPSLYRTDPAAAWRRLKGLNRLAPAGTSHCTCPGRMARAPRARGRSPARLDPRRRVTLCDGDARARLPVGARGHPGAGAVGRPQARRGAAAADSSSAARRRDRTHVAATSAHERGTGTRRRADAGGARCGHCTGDRP